MHVVVRVLHSCTLIIIIYNPTYQIFADFDETSDEPKPFQLLVDTTGSSNYRYCYLDTTNNGVGYFNTQNIVTYMNLSRKYIILCHQLCMR